MKKFGVSEARKIVEEAVNDYVYYRLATMSDEDFLEADLRYDFELDSLDFGDMFDAIQKRYGIVVDAYNPLVKHPFNEDETVANLIDMVNYCSEHEA